LYLGTSLGISSQWEGWLWVALSLFFLPSIVFTIFKIRARRKEAARANQQEQERLERKRQRELARLARAQQKEDARIARLQERERAKAAKVAAPKKAHERPRITRPLRAPITQKLEPEE
jgi:hypothetical protein